MTRKALILGFALAAVAGMSAQLNSGVGPQDKCGPPPPVKLTAIGHPIWKPVDFHVFTAPVGGGADTTPFGETMTYLLYPQRHQGCAGLGRGPGSPHQPPYLHEMEAGLDVMNYREDSMFSVKEFSPPNGVFATYMVVPNPGTKGSSPDFASGPIIPNALFPISFAGETYRDSRVWDAFLTAGAVPPLTGHIDCDLFNLDLNVDGHSHFPMFIAEGSTWGAGGSVTGNYEFRITMTDTTGSGWNILVSFKVR